VESPAVRRHPIIVACAAFDECASLIITLYTCSQEFYQAMVPWVQQGKVKYQETVLEGFHQLPKCMIGRGMQSRVLHGS